MKKQIVALLAGAMLMMATSAMALPIDGTINFMGSLNLTGGVGSTLLNSTSIDFVEGTTFVTQDVTGVYASIPVPPAGFTVATFTDFNYSSFTPVSNLWLVSSGASVFSFDLNAISNISDTSLTGTGMLHASGYDDTLGTFFLTTQNGLGNVSFSATSSVPEPGTMMLLGLGMFGLAIYGKRRMNKEA